jgi:putative ABC transport system permease protein
VSTPLLLAAAVSLPFVAIIARNPVVRRLALRSPTRRPIEAMLVVLGSMLGTGIVTGSLIVGDTMDRSVRAGAYEQLGPVDVLVAVEGLLAPDAVAAAVAAIEREGKRTGAVDGAVSIVAVSAAVRGERNQPRAQLLELDFVAGRELGASPADTGIEGPTPAPGSAVISDDLAERVGATPGNSITVFVYGVPVELTVDRVVERRGLAGFWQLDARQQSYNVFVTPGSLAAALGSVELPASVAPPMTYLAVSSPGSVEGAAERSDDAIAAVVTALGDDVSVQPVKRDVLESADQVAVAISDLYLTLGVFTVAAGILLLVNIFVMLADERRSQLGVLRALGMRRSTLVGSFATEGWLYALLSAVLGALAGIQIGRLIAWRAGTVLTGGDELTSLRLVFAYEWRTVLDGFAIGLLISLATVLFTSVRVSRLNVIAAIRDLPPPSRQRRVDRRVWAGVVLLVAGSVWTALAIAAREAYGFAVGPMLAFTGAGVLMSRPIGVRTATSVAAAGVAGWGVVCVPLLAEFDMSVGVPIFLVQGLGMCLAGVALLIVHQRALASWLSRRGSGSLSVRIGLAYPLARVFRTVVTLTMFALVVLTIVYLSSVSAMFGGSVDATTERISGGWDVIVTSNPTDPVGPDTVLTSSSAVAVAPATYTFAEFRWNDGQPVTWALTAVGEEFAAAPPTLVDRGNHRDDLSAWRAVVDDPDLVIVDEFFLNTGATRSVNPRVGDRVELIDPVSGRHHVATITALAPTDFLFSGAFYGAHGASDLLGSRAVANRLWVRSDRPEVLADELGREFVANGADAVAIRDAVEIALVQTTGFFTVMQEYVAIGLLVGIAGVGVITVRSVRERRRDVAVLRSLGLDGRSIGKAFLFEALFVSISGAVLGIAVGLVGAWSLTIGDLTIMEGAGWVAPWGEVVVVLVLVTVAVTVCTVVPARSAGRIRPAVALRIVE